MEDKRTRVDINDYKITGVKSEITGIKEKNDESDNMALIEEAIAEAKRDIAEGTKLLAKIADEDRGEDAWDKNVIHPETQVATTDNVYNMYWRGN